MHTGGNRTNVDSVVHRPSRRTFLGTVYGATIGALLAACGTNDADVFNNADGSATSVSAGDGSPSSGSSDQTLRVQTGDSSATTGADASSTAAETTSSVESTTEAPSTSSTSASNASSPGGSGGALPSGATMVVEFTYEQGSGGKNVPPYIAVWVEDGSGQLLTTIALWYQQYGRGEQWLPDLTRWYNVDQKRISTGGADTVDAISGATRSPGRYQVAWDGTVNGSPTAAGSYFICIESARERGPYSLIRQAVNLNGDTVQTTLGADGELSGASLTVST